MCPLEGRRYYEWTSGLNVGFGEYVRDHRAQVLERLADDSTVSQLLVEFELLPEDDGLATYLARIDAPVSRQLKGQLYSAVDDGADVYFDWQLAEEWDSTANPLNGGSTPAVAIILHGPQPELATSQS